MRSGGPARSSRVGVSEQAAGLRRYADVLGAPGVGRVVCAALLGRLPSGMAPLATVLLLRGEGRSYAVAGVVVAASSIASAIGWPLWGRLVDRIGQAQVLLPLGVVYPAAFAGLALLATHGAPVVALTACSALAGATLPPLGACMRALWPSLLESQGLRDTAYALEAWLQELFFVFGPLIAAAVAVVASPWAAVLTASAFAAIGTIWFALMPAVRAVERKPRPPSRAGALGSAAVRTVMLSTFAMGVAFGIVEVAMPAFGEVHGSRAQGGFALSCFALGSLLGGLWIGTRPPSRGLTMRFALALAALALALVPPLLAPSILVMCALMLIAGLPIAPAFAASYGLIDELAVPGTTTEAFALLGTAIVAGLSLGTSVSGVAIEQLGLTGALALAAPCVGIATLLAVARRGSLMISEAVP
jgi:MFS family permease